MSNIKRKFKKLIRCFNKVIEKRYLKKIRSVFSKKSITIVSNNCIGGVIYHNLGLQFQSPTINLAFCKGREYLAFVKNFKYYSKCDVVECLDEDRGYPVGMVVPLDEQHIPIKLAFQHYNSFEDAKKKWVERYSRVDWDNVYFLWEFYDTMGDKKVIDEFDRLEGIKKMIITHRKFDDLKNSFTVSCYRDDKPVAQILNYKGVSGKRYLEEFDYISFLMS